MQREALRPGPATSRCSTASSTDVMTLPPRRWSDEMLNEFREEFIQHARAFAAHDREEKVFRAKILEAFPNGDTGEHRKYHESLMEAAEEQKRFYRELRLGLAKNSVWAATMTLLGLLLLGGIAKMKSLLGIVP